MVNAYILIILIIVSILFCFITRKLLNNSNNYEHFIKLTLEQKDSLLNPITFYINKYNKNNDDMNFALSISRVYPTIINKDLTTDKIIGIINNKPNTVCIMNKTDIINKYYKGLYTDISYMMDLYYEYIYVLIPNTIKINNISNIIKQRPAILILKHQYDFLKKLCELVFKGIKIQIIDNIEFLDNNKPCVILLTAPEFSKIIYDFSTIKRFYILGFDVNDPIIYSKFDYIKIYYPGIAKDRLDVSLLNNTNPLKSVNTVRFTISLFTNTKTRLYNFTQTVFQNIEAIRYITSDKHFKITFRLFRPEFLIKLDTIPLHYDVYNYFKKIGLITYNKDSICANTIATIKCKPHTIWENRFRLLNL